MKYKQPSFVSGKSIQDIMNLDIGTFNQLKASDMKKVVGRLVSAGNKRLRSFEKAKESSPATRYVEKTGGKFTTKGKNLNELRAEYLRAKNFLQSKTGTRKGWKTVKKETASGLEKQGVKVDAQSLDKMWKAYEKLKEASPEVANKGLKYAVLRDIADMTTDNSNMPLNKIVDTMQKNLDSIYENQMELNNEFDSVSGFFKQ